MGVRNRKSGFEILRIISIAMIVAFHCVFKSGFDFSKELSGNKVMLDVIYHLGELGVNCFILLSGYFFDVTKFKWKKVCSIVGQVLFFTFVGQVVLTVLHLGHFSIGAFVLPVLRDKYWFVTVYIFLYLLTPYLKKLIQALTQKEFLTLIGIQLFIWSVYPTIFLGLIQDSTEAMPYYNRYIWLLLVYLIGAYIKLYGIKFLSNMKQSVLFVGGCSAFLLLFIFVMEMKLVPGRLLKDPFFFWRPNALPLILLSVGVFQIFNHMEVKANKIVNYIASCTLGVYALHDGALASFWWSEVFQANLYQDSPWLFLRILCAVVVIISVGVILDTIRKCVVDRLLNFVWDKASVHFNR